MRRILILAALGLGILGVRGASGAEVTWAQGDAVGTVLVSYHHSLGTQALEAEARRLGLAPGVTASKLREVLVASVRGRVDLDVPSLDLQRVRLSGTAATAVDAVMREFRLSPLVLAAEPDHPTKIASIALNDPLYTGGQQWYLTNTSWPQAVAAYNAGSIQLQTLVVVAVVDSGVGSHSDLDPQVLPGASFVSAEPSTTDLNGHGTFCSGLIAAVTGNGSGMAGAFFEPALIKVLPVKVLDACGQGFTSDMAAGISYATSHGARVINLSIQASQGSQAMENAVDFARQNGVLLAAAAGNQGGNTSYPAVYSQVLAVGSLNRDGTRASYSNFGKLDLSAPGGNFDVPGCNCQSIPAPMVTPTNCPNEIWSLSANRPQASCATAEPYCLGSNLYEAGAGTSFAAPLVSAAAALLFSQDPSRQVEDVQRILLQTASVTALGAGYHPETGWGKLNFYGALTYQGTPQAGAPLKAYNWPNPFNPGKDGLTTLVFFLPGTAPTTVRLLDAGGDLVKSWNLEPGKAVAGMNLIVWDGRNGHGAMVANGPYTLVVESGGQRTTAVVAVVQ